MVRITRQARCHHLLITLEEKTVSEQITVVGTIVNDPERRRTGTGVTVANFRLASNVRRRDEASHTWVDGHTNWFSVSAYRGLAEHALDSLRKGQRVIVVGSFKLREWEANGRQGVAAEIDASSLGHDLLWGSSRFQRADPSAPEHDSTVGSSGGMAASPGSSPESTGEWAAAPLADATPF